MIVAGAALAVLLPSTMAQANPTPSEIAAQIKDSNNKLELIVESYDKITGDLATTQAALAALQTKMAPLQNSVDSAYANVNQLAVTAYTSSSSMRTISALLSSSSSDNLVDQLVTLQELSKAQSADIKIYTNQKAGFDAENKRLNDLLAQQNAQKADLEAKKAQIQGDLTKLAALQSKAGTTGGNTGGGGGSSVSLGPIPPVSGKAAAAVSFAYAHAQPNHHYMYHWGASGPSEYDCSGFTMAAWANAGVSLPHNAASQYSKTRHISRSQLQPGDLVFYNGLGHVAIYVGNNTVIHAPHTGTWVQAATITMDPIVGYGRVVG